MPRRDVESNRHIGALSHRVSEFLANAVHQLAREIQHKSAETPEAR